MIDVDTFLSHHGVKGQKWGILHPDELFGRKKKTKTKESSKEKAVLTKLGPHGYTEDRMRKMYGPETSGDSNEKFHLTPLEKKLMIIGGVAVVGGLAVYGLNKYGLKSNSLMKDIPLKPNAISPITEAMNKVDNTAILNVGQGFSEKAIASLSDTPKTLKVGSVVKRISMTAESEIHPDGFYASDLPADVERYKAILPIYWKRWSPLNKSEGFIVSLTNTQEIRSPSPKQTFNIFTSMLSDKSNVPGLKIGDALRKEVPEWKALNDHDLARHLLPSAAGNWNNSKLPLTQTFFTKLKDLKFNAVPDLNDSLGNLSDSPMRFLDGNMFKIVKNDVLSEHMISDAQDAIVAIAHMINNFLSNYILGEGDEEVDLDIFLEHHGVKGQKWGIRRDPNTGVRPIANTLEKSKFGKASIKRAQAHSPGTVETAIDRRLRSLGEKHRNKADKVVIHPRGRTVIAHPSRKDKKWQKNLYTLHGVIAVHNNVADQMNNGILDKLNSKSEYKNHQMIDKFGEPNQDKVSQAYFKEYEKLNWQATERAVSAVHGVSPSGKFKAVLDKYPNGQWQVKIHKVSVTHADTPWEDLVINVYLDALGHVVQASNIKDSVGQSSITTEDFLSHHGVKGQKWGIRNLRKNIKTSADHKKIENLRKRSASSLSNNQLKTLNERRNLEENYKRLNPSVVQKGKKQVEFILGTAGLGFTAYKMLTSKEAQKLIYRGRNHYKQLKLFK